MSLQDSETAAALRNIGNVKNPTYKNSGVLTISKTVTTEDGAYAAGALFSYTASPQGALLYLMALSYDSTAAGNYKYIIDGLNIKQNVFNTFPAGATSFDLVPSGTALFVAPNTNINVYAYNYNSATSDGSMTVFLMVDEL